MSVIVIQMLVLFLLTALSFADKQIFNGTLSFHDACTVKLTYPFEGYGIVDNITYNVSVQNNYNNMVVLRMPRLYNIVGANNLTAIVTRENITCEYVCPRGWTTTTMSYVDFYSYGPSNITYWIEVNYDIKTFSTEIALIPIYVLGGFMGLGLILVVVFCLYRRHKANRVYQQL